MAPRKKTATPVDPDMITNSQAKRLMSHTKETDSKNVELLREVSSLERALRAKKDRIAEMTAEIVYLKGRGLFGRIFDVQYSSGITPVSVSWRPT